MLAMIGPDGFLRRDRHPLDGAPLFMPVVGPWYKGLAVSVPLDRTAIRAATRGHQTTIDRAAIHAALAARYAGAPLVPVQPKAQQQEERHPVIVGGHVLRGSRTQQPASAIRPKL